MLHQTLAFAAEMSDIQSEYVRQEVARVDSIVE